MKRNTTTRALALAAFAFALGVAPMAKADNKGCSLATLKGTWADKDTGFITAPPQFAGTFAALTVETYDGNGNVTFSGTASLNGNIVSSTAKGTYTVNPDCTGTYTAVNPVLGITAHAVFVIADSGNELQILVTDPGTVISCIARRQFPAGDWRE